MVTVQFAKRSHNYIKSTTTQKERGIKRKNVYKDIFYLLFIQKEKVFKCWCLTQRSVSLISTAPQRDDDYPTLKIRTLTLVINTSLHCNGIIWKEGCRGERENVWGTNTKRNYDEVIILLYFYFYYYYQVLNIMNYYYLYYIILCTSVYWWSYPVGLTKVVEWPTIVLKLGQEEAGAIK